MKNSTIILGAIFVLLIIGLFFTQTESFFPTVTQVSNPEASTHDVTSDKGVQLAALSVIVVVSVGMMAGTLYAILWFLNREVVRVKQQPEQPFELLSFSTEGNTTGALLANNVLYLVVGLGALMVLGALALLVVTL